MLRGWLNSCTIQLLWIIHGKYMVFWVENCQSSQWEGWERVRLGCIRLATLACGLKLVTRRVNWGLNRLGFRIFTSLLLTLITKPHIFLLTFVWDTLKRCVKSNQNGSNLTENWLKFSPTSKNLHRSKFVGWQIYDVALALVKGNPSL